MLSGLDFGVVVFITNWIHSVSSGDVRSDRTESDNNSWRISSGGSPDLYCRAKIWRHARYPSPALQAPSPLGGERDGVRGAFGFGLQYVSKLLRNDLVLISERCFGSSPRWFLNTHHWREPSVESELDSKMSDCASLS